MTNEEFIDFAKLKVAVMADPERYHLNYHDVFVVWYAKTLQNHKALLATPLPDDNHYYEATYNGDKDELYIDMYCKQANRCYKNVSKLS